MKTKVTILVILSVIFMSFVAEKFVVIRFKEEQINYHWQNLNAVKQIVNTSDISHKQANYILQSIDSLQRDIQLNASLDSTDLSKPPKK